MRSFLPFLAVGLGVVVACSSSDSATDGAGEDGGAVGADAGRCTLPADCPTGLCDAPSGKCLAATAVDGVKNGTETDVDCGGAAAPACADLKTCAAATDCKSAVCTGGVCQVPTATDTVKNGDETGIDCGGPSAPKCKTGGGCKADTDCDNVLCDTATGTCAAVSDSDGLKNGDETDVDCGGPTTPKKCGTGKICTATSDCDKAICNATTKVCNPPTHSDGITNLGETDIDCGGPDTAKTDASAAKKCVEGKTCSADTDCDDFCNATAHVCVTGRSCKGDVAAATAGLVTCGTAESNDDAKKHQSCCRSLALPDNTARLDKYEVTAGRFRQFLASVGPNIRKWVSDEITNNTATGQRLAADIPTSLRGYLPASDTPGDPMNIVMQVGGTIMDASKPSAVQGCYNDAGAYGHNTYWRSQTELASHFADHPARRWAQSVYDEKSMNCSPYWMYAAFCAWDGGRMPTTAEIQKVWPATSQSPAYPWGQYATTKPVLPTDRPVAPAVPGSALIANDYTNTVNQNNNGFIFYAYPDVGNAADTAGYIAAPGRFFRDATIAVGQPSDTTTKEPWIDLGANLFEMTKVLGSGSSTFCDFNVFDGDVVDTVNCKHQTGTVNGQPVYEYGVKRGTGLPSVQWIGGSWEGHTIPTTSPVGSTQGAQVQYGKTGFRCARAKL